MDKTYDAAVEQALRMIDLETKVSLLCGKDHWSLPAVPAIGLASIVMSDGPIGVRGVGWTPHDPAVALPSPTALAATWDTELARTAGRVLGQEARRKGVHVLLAPTVNLHRTPRGGRHFECYSEDPLLTAEIAVGYVAGVQQQGVAATIKHFVGNDSETQRFTVDVRIGDRALREMYLAPFEPVVTRAGVWAVMAAYNGVNGATMTENEPLLRGVLKGEWGFDGIVVSDWRAARSVAPAVLGGLDVAMPALQNPWGQALVEAVRSGAVDEKLVDEQVRRVLLLAARVGALDTAPPAVAQADRPAELDGAAVAREVATRSFVLARNEASLLPINPQGLSRIAVLGAFAQDARIQGGGSAQVYAAHGVSALEGLSAALPSNVELRYAVGADPSARRPPVSGPQWTTTGGATGLTVTIRDHAGATRYQCEVISGLVRWLGSPPAGLARVQLATIELSGRLTPTAGGVHELTISGRGGYRLAVAGEEVFTKEATAEDADPTKAYDIPPEIRIPVRLDAGHPVDVTLTHTVLQVPGAPPFLSFSLGHVPPRLDPDELMEEAVGVAADADVAVVVVGTTEEVESEGFDRKTLTLPGRQDELVARVAAANPRTIVVVNAGASVLLPWVDDVAAVLLTWFPGQEGGAALADVLLGRAEPGGRLPTTWPRRAEDCPVLAVEPVDGELHYDEGVFVGYRGWERSGVEPLFPFGHGGGYTTWSYESLSFDAGTPAGGFGMATVRLRNTGARAGREVVQIYLGPAEPDPRRPPRWLAGFAVAAAGPGETVTVTIAVPDRAAQIWEDGWRTVPGRYLVEAAHSIVDRPLSTFVTV